MALNALLNASSRLTVDDDGGGTKNGAVVASDGTAREGSCVGTKVSKSSGAVSGSPSASWGARGGTWLERCLGLLGPGWGAGAV
jgi:hypothetical protein